MSSQDDLFQPVIQLPEDVRDERYRRLVGLDPIKTRLRKEAVVLANPAALARWAAEHHPAAARTGALLKLIGDRTPLIVFGGDVGSGKSALAESFGCDLSRTLNVPAYLWRLKLAARGSGLVGEMTSLIGEAFDHLRVQGEKSRTSNGIKAIQIFVVDEADALVQSREATQMHHEDRAGVDAFLAGIDGLAGTGLPVIVVLCTNRLNALDPAVRRRAAATFEFRRPTAEQRRHVLTDALAVFDADPSTIDKLVDITGHDTGASSGPGYTFSDLTQRLIPTVILEAFPDKPITGDLMVDIAQGMKPTPVFNDQSVPEDT
jgi:AAA+ superfamily predicted ATPase